MGKPIEMELNRDEIEKLQQILVFSEKALKDLRKWKKRMKEVDSEEEIAREIEVDMITKGFVLISEVRE